MRKSPILALVMTCLSSPAFAQQAAAPAAPNVATPGVQAAPSITGTVATPSAVAPGAQPAPNLTGTVPAAPNPVNPGGTAPTQAAPSVTGGVPNPVTPLGVDPRTQLPLGSTGQAAVPTPQNSLDTTPEPHLTPLGAATMQNSIGRPHPVTSGSTSGAATTTQRAPEDAGCGFSCGSQAD